MSVIPDILLVDMAVKVRRNGMPPHLIPFLGIAKVLDGVAILIKLLF